VSVAGVYLLSEIVTAAAVAGFGVSAGFAVSVGLAVAVSAGRAVSVDLTVADGDGVSAAFVASGDFAAPDAAVGVAALLSSPPQAKATAPPATIRRANAAGRSEKERSDMNPPGSLLGEVRR
jgi:hypothetical protein